MRAVSEATWQERADATGSVKAIPGHTLGARGHSRAVFAAFVRDLQASAPYGLVTAGVFAYLEVWLTYGTGDVPRGDLWLLLVFDVLLWTSVVGVLAFAQALTRRGALPGARSVSWQVTAILLIAPVLLFGTRGAFGGPELSERWWVPALRGGVTAALLAVLAVRIRQQQRTGCPFPLPLWVGWTFTSQVAAVAGLAVRSVSPGDLEARAANLITGLCLYALVLLGPWTWRARRAQLTATSLLVVSAGSAFLAAQWWGLQPGGSRSSRTPPGISGPSTPNILLITLDTVRRDHISSYGYSRRTTPRIDALAARSVVFEDAYANSPYTLSSHASLFTGRLPSGHGAHPVPYTATAPATRPGTLPDFPLESRLETLASRLAARGYRTGAIVANTAYLAPWTGLARGFGHYDANVERMYGFVPCAVPALLRISPRLYHTVEPARFRSARAITDLAVDWVGQQQERPFFLFLNYFDAHSPYVPPPPYDRLFPAAASAARTNIDRLEPDITSGTRRLGRDEREFLVSQYDGAIAYLDAHVGRLLESLARRRLLDGMLVVVTSDHGEFFGEHGLVLHAMALYEEVLRIPLLVKLPFQAEGLRAQRRVSLRQVWDIVWMVLDDRASPSDLLGLEEPDKVIAEHWVHRGLHARNPERFHSAAMRAVYDGRWKLIQTIAERDELYDLERDPQEQANILSCGGDSSAESRRIRADLPSLSDAVNPRASSPPADRAVVQRLRSLGYVR
jgi:arylsulfatase A-like enzyme